jgi:hypothetical protein
MANYTGLHTGNEPQEAGTRTVTKQELQQHIEVDSLLVRNAEDDPQRHGFNTKEEVVALDGAIKAIQVKLAERYFSDQPDQKDVNGAK